MAYASKVIRSSLWLLWGGLISFHANSWPWVHLFSGKSIFRVNILPFSPLLSHLCASFQNFEEFTRSRSLASSPSADLSKRCMPKTLSNCQSFKNNSVARGRRLEFNVPQTGWTPSAQYSKNKQKRSLIRLCKIPARQLDCCNLATKTCNWSTLNETTDVLSGHLPSPWTHTVYEPFSLRFRLNMLIINQSSFWPDNS